MGRALVAGLGALGASRAIRVLRFGLGVVWSLNLLYVLAPANRFIATFSATVQAVASPLAGGPLVLAAVASRPIPFAIATALLTAFLAVAFLTGRAARWACAAGFAFNATLLWLQLGSLVTLPGGTDVGPHPLYLLAYVALWMAYSPLPTTTTSEGVVRSRGLRGIASRFPRVGHRVRGALRPRGVRAEDARSEPTGR